MGIRNVKYLLILIPVLLLHTAILAQNAPKFKVKGGARSLLSNAEITVQDSVPDEVTARKNAGGYALMDLGFNIMPNKNTEIMGMIRINNKFGGFWGAGVTFDVRQLWLKGIIADKVRYQLGDINLKQTPFTFWNHNEDRQVQQPAVFDLQRDIVNYESFYLPGTWRQQGAAVDFGLESGRLSSEWNFHGYLTRLNATNFGNQPERLHAGTTMSWTFANALKASYNLSRIFDVKETATSNVLFQNTVQTAALEYNKSISSLNLTVGGESGMSSYRIVHDTAAPHLQDFFLHAFSKVTPKNKRWELELGYLNVGPDFRSFAAQSKRLDYSAVPNFYNRYTQLQTDRPLHIADFMNNSAMYRTGISTKLMSYNPLINNVLPYGLATFNRKGFYLKAQADLFKKVVQTSVQQYNLSEVVGQGTPELKQFAMTRADLTWHAGSTLHWKKQWKFTFSGCRQQTQRKSPREYEVLKLNSMQASAGIEIEVMKDIDLMAGYTTLQGKGSEMGSTRNNYTEVIDFGKYAADLKQDIAGAGLRVRFSGKTYLALMYQQMRHRDKANPFQNYQIGQMMAIYNMTF